MRKPVTSVVLVSELDKLGMELPFNIRRPAELMDIMQARYVSREWGAWKASAAGPCAAFQDEDGELVCLVEIVQETSPLN